VKLDDRLFFERQSSTKKWTTVSVTFNSGDSNRAIVLAQHNGKKSLFDNFELVTEDVASGISNQSISLAATGKSPDLPPGSNFNLLAWYLSTPEPNSKGLSTRISERELDAGYQHPDYFYTADDGGMVFKATVIGARTSNNTKYTRTELREMLRKGDTSINTIGANRTPNANSWVFSTAPNKDKKIAGGVDGILKASLAINHVTTTGEAYQIGRVIIGQIHASDDEPIRLYYRKLPNNDNGSIYAAHQPHGGKDQWYEIIGSRSNSADNPEDGISLNEVFDYEIQVKGNQLYVLISKGGEVIGDSQIDMSDSGYDRGGEYMYFKAGVYNQNNSGDPDDYVQATFYALEAAH
jgi:poly(beta-D-mannuronate) lyase